MSQGRRRKNLSENYYSRYYKAGDLDTGVWSFPPLIERDIYDSLKFNLITKNAKSELKLLKIRLIVSTPGAARGRSRGGCAGAWRGRAGSRAGRCPRPPPRCRCGPPPPPPRCPGTASVAQRKVPWQGHTRLAIRLYTSVGIWVWVMCRYFTLNGQRVWKLTR